MRQARRQRRAEEWKANKQRKKAEKEAENKNGNSKNIQEELDLSEEAVLFRSEKQKSKRERFLMATEEGYTVVLDCGFETDMTFREKKSLSQQIMFSYGANRRSKVPFSMALTGLQGETKALINHISGSSSWLAMLQTSRNYMDIFKKESLVYLTADSPNVIDHLDKDKVYIIGAIVDRNRLKNITLDKAKEQNITTAKLPLDQYVHLGCLTRVLTVNHIVSILLHYAETKDWEKAIQLGLPQRKQVKRKEKEVIETIE